MTVVVERQGQLQVGEDESYRLVIEPDGVQLRATTDLGALHGFETVLQLLSADEDGYYLPALNIDDAPRFAWRGLMIDSGRHFLPVDVLKRNLDGMAAVKMNVLHWHLTEDQGFRIESKVYPELHQQGSDGFFYTQEQVRDVIAYADQRGIRVYPEFDVPGHATSWLVSHPEIAAAPGPYEIERSWGIFDPTLDPTNEATYALLDRLFAEMAALFPDDYFHIGGDEVTGKQWAANPAIQAFMKQHGIEDAHGLQAHFNRRVLEILTRHGKKMVGWEEILQPGMPKDIVIHSWRGSESLVAAARDGYRSILSSGYYIDLMRPASHHYLNDPLPEGSGLTAEQAQLVLGGEATMWSEHVTAETIDSRIWPRTAAIAERLWSSAEVDDVLAMYRRLDTIALQLEEHGLTHIKNRSMMMRRLANGFDIGPLRTLADVVEPLKIYQRNADDRYRSHSPYTLLPDVAVADARDARIFNRRVTEFLESGDADLVAALRSDLERWRSNHEAFSRIAERSPALREALPISEALHEIASLGLEALDRITAEGDETSAWSVTPGEIIETARRPVAKVELQIVDAIARLVGRAAGII